MKKELLFAVSAALLLASCSNDENQVVSAKAVNELGVKVNLPATRGETNTFMNGSSVGVFVDGVAAGTYTPKVATYAFDGSVWSGPATEADKIFLSGNDANVYGFYPSTATVATDTKIMTCSGIPAAQNFTADEATDYMYTTALQADIAPVVTLPVVSTKETGVTTANLFFHHAMSKISFVVNKSNTYPQGIGAGKVTKITLTASDNRFSTDGAVDLKTGSFAAGTKTNVLTLSGSANANEYASPASATTTAFGLFAPCTDLSNITITFTVDGTEMTKTLTTNTITKWDPNYNYIYTVTILPTELDITCQIVPWAVQYEDLGTVKSVPFNH
jgi:hypothetical protein